MNTAAARTISAMSTPTVAGATDVATDAVWTETTIDLADVVTWGAVAGAPVGAYYLWVRLTDGTLIDISARAARATAICNALMGL